ncbi:MAG TPA: GspMb/PilO family protein [Pyrinomonadaceae bacterium]|nr:hypothetical protein [Chloracidobacterium sp.]MBP9935627.1 hypothetical protein [Pyrinomonadaceae bacterium]MBK7802274.1 hypothetical protein [Chloracidobacterium sp.]MBK9437147.1 hypothetical protein [Chloracidobacterium sp.]MBL0239819.1 hypothetical protein [Chloracidobacterium sp.]
MAEIEATDIETVELPPAHLAPVTPEVLARRPRKVAGGMWGPVEVAALAGGAVALGLVVLLYIFAIAPAGRELARNRSEADRLEAEKLSAKTKYGEITTTEAQVGKLLASVDDFETRFLPPSVNGRSALYQRINSLILAYGLTNTTGPDYQNLETADANKENVTDEERGRAKFRSLFPGIYVTMTVEGSYQSLRRFIRDLETGNEFVVVSTVEIEPSDSETDAKPDLTKPPAVQPGGDGSIGGFPGTGKPDVGQTGVAKPKGKTHGEIVALHLELAAYFRRANYAPMIDKGTNQ